MVTALDPQVPRHEVRCPYRGAALARWALRAAKFIFKHPDLAWCFLVCQVLQPSVVTLLERKLIRKSACLGAPQRQEGLSS